MLWNVILQPHEIAFAWGFNMGDKVRALFALTPDCPTCILDADFLDVRFIGVPLEPGIKIFKTEGLARCLMVRQHLERLRLDIQGVDDLSKCPVQLGWADITEWQASKDPCRLLSKKKGLAHMLQTRCRCGQVSWTRLNKKLSHSTYSD